MRDSTLEQHFQRYREHRDSAALFRLVERALAGMPKIYREVLEPRLGQAARAVDLGRAPSVVRAQLELQVFTPGPPLAATVTVLVPNPHSMAGYRQVVRRLKPTPNQIADLRIEADRIPIEFDLPAGGNEKLHFDLRSK